MPWLLSRRRLITFVLVDIFLFFIINIKCLSFINKDFQLDDFSYILILWILFSYILGRYAKGSEGFNIIQILKFIFSSIFVFILSFSFFLLLLWPFNYGFNSLEELKLYFSFFLFFSFISGTTQFCINKLIRPRISKSSNLIFVGKKLTAEKINLELKKSNIKASLKLVQLFNLSLEEKKLILQNCDGLIIEDISSFLTSEVPKIIEMNKIKISIWTISLFCSEIIQRYPSGLVSPDKILNLRIMQRYSVEMRIKRIADIFISFLLILFSIPFLVLIFILIKIEDGGPFLYFQKRTGLREKIFRIYKIRSMKVDAEKEGARWSSSNDSRITKIGKFLRLTRIDELPQLLSVIVGDMSLIGPRPERPEFNKILSEKIIGYNIRHLVKPGLSGWAQVNYPYGASIEDSQIKLTYDLYYMKNFSVFLDMLIFIKTIKLVSTLKGAIPKK